MDIAGSVALVTGSNRGIGNAFVRVLQQRGAARVYATARNPELVDIPGVEVLQLDVTDPASVARAAEQASDVTLVISNAGIAANGPLLTGDLDHIRLVMETNFFGTLNVARAFAPVLGANGGGAILTVVSALAWFSLDGVGPYAASKAAAWSLTDSIRIELAPQGTQVTGLYVGAVDTDVMAGIDVPKSAPEDIARITLDGVETGLAEVIADAMTAQVKLALSKSPEERYAQALTLID